MSIGAFNPLVDNYEYAPAPAPGPSQDQGMAVPSSQSMQAGYAISAADLQGTRPITGLHNTPLHVAFLGLIAIGIVVFLRLAGFKFSFAGSAKVGRG